MELFAHPMLKVGLCRLFAKCHLAMIDTFAPLRATSEATLSPIPLDPPVMRTCLPKSSVLRLAPYFSTRFRRSNDLKTRAAPIKPITMRPKVKNMMF